MENWGELIAFAWIGSALFSATLASAKNRSGCGWFAVGLVLGPVGLLVSFLIPKAAPPTVGSERDEDAVAGD
jgi:hypothetical protein